MLLIFLQYIKETMQEINHQESCKKGENGKSLTNVWLIYMQTDNNEVMDIIFKMLLQTACLYIQ